MRFARRTRRWPVPLIGALVLITVVAPVAHATETPPEVTVPDDFAVLATSPSGAVVTYAASAFDLDGIDSFSCTPPSGSTFPIGTTTVTCTAIDDLGAQASASFQVTVHRFPQVTVPADFTVPATGPDGAVVTYEASATDDDGIDSFSCTPPSGSTFPIGTTTVTCTAVDIYGAQASASFEITVNVPPEVTVPDDITVPATSPSGAVVTYVASATDAGGLSAFDCAPASGSTFPLGTTTVTCTATDTSGAQTSASFTVTVRDGEPPVIAPSADLVVSATGPSGAVVVYTPPATSDDLDGAGTAACSPAPGSLFSVGDTTVTCTASDTSGNEATPTTFNVRVVYALGVFTSPLPKSTLQKAASTIPVKFTLAGIADGSALAANRQLRAVLTSAGSATVVASAFCTWDAKGLFACPIKTPKNLLTGRSNPYEITVQQTLTPNGAQNTFFAVPGSSNPQTIFFK